jgi:anti-anti-sigma regulatory factor
MTVRITRATVDGDLCIRIEGGLEGADASSLEDELAPEAPSLRIDLSGLLSADPAAVRSLKSLRDSGAQLTGGSIYIRHLLADRSECGGD